MRTPAENGRSEQRAGSLPDFRTAPGVWMNSIYVCHTYYHVFVTMLKELNKPVEERGKATLVLSRMSNDFEDFKAKFKKKD